MTPQSLLSAFHLEGKITEVHSAQILKLLEEAIGEYQRKNGGRQIQPPEWWNEDTQPKVSEEWRDKLHKRFIIKDTRNDWYDDTVPVKDLESFIESTLAAEVLKDRVQTRRVQAEVTRRETIEEIMNEHPESTWHRSEDSHGRCSECEVYSSTCYHGGRAEVHQEIFEHLNSLLPLPNKKEE